MGNQVDSCLCKPGGPGCRVSIGFVVGKVEFTILPQYTPDLGNLNAIET